MKKRGIKKNSMEEGGIKDKMDKRRSKSSGRWCLKSPKRSKATKTGREEECKDGVETDCKRKGTFNGPGVQRKEAFQNKKRYTGKGVR